MSVILWEYGTTGIAQGMWRQLLNEHLLLIEGHTVPDKKLRLDGHP